MTNTAWNTIGRISRLTPAVLLFLALVLFGFPSGMRAADEPLGPFLFVSSTRTPKDVEIEAKVRRALRQDAQLRSLNLGVHVSSGIANLSGPVPAVQFKQRAASIVQRIDGVLSVITKDLYISTADPGGKPLLVVIQDDRPTQTRSASPNSPIRETDQRITLLAPEMVAPTAPALPSPKAVEGGGRATRLTANPHPASSAASISLTIERLRQRETRYQQIRVRVQGTTVYVFPNGTASEDVMTFAQAVRRLSGVQHVIMASDPR